MATLSNLTEGDRKILVMAWHSFKTQPQIDYLKLATLGKYKTAASATACYLAARKKLLSTDTPNAKPMTDNDRKLIVLAWQCFKEIPTVDYKVLQQKGGYKTAASATACYLATRKKLLNAGSEMVEGSVASAPGVSSSSATAKKGAGTKRKVGKKAKGEEILIANAKRAKHEEVKEEVGNDEGDEEAVDGEEASHSTVKHEVVEEHDEMAEAEKAELGHRAAETGDKADESAAMEDDLRDTANDEMGVDGFCNSGLLEGAQQYLLEQGNGEVQAEEEM